MTPLEEVLGLWAELPASHQVIAVALLRALHSTVDRPSTRKTVEVRGRPTVEVPNAGRFGLRRRKCPNCQVEIKPPPAGQEQWGYCPDCGCLLPTWRWGE